MAPMKSPKRLQSLIDEGLIDNVVRQLMSGKEATVYVVRCGDETRCAKVYKEATQRSFRQAVDYTENRKVQEHPPGARDGQGHALRPRRPGGGLAERRGRRAVPAGRRRRARAAAVQLLRRRAADGTGHRRARRRRAAPERRGFTPEEARRTTPRCCAEVVRMLCAGVVHGDLSEFNILLGADGPVIIDLPQAVDAAGNNHAQAHAAARRRQPARLLRPLRARVARHRLRRTRSGISTSAVRCTPTRRSPAASKHEAGAVDLGGVMREIDDARAEEAARRLRMQAAG